MAAKTEGRVLMFGCGWGGCSRKQFESEKVEEEEKLRGVKEAVEERQEAVEAGEKHAARRTEECVARESALAMKEGKVEELARLQQADRAVLERLKSHLERSKEEIGEQREDCAAAMRRLEEEKAFVQQEWEKVQLRLQALDHREEELELREITLAAKAAHVAEVVGTLEGREAEAQQVAIHLVRHGCSLLSARWSVLTGASPAAGSAGEGVSRSGSKGANSAAG